MSPNGNEPRPAEGTGLAEDEQACGRVVASSLPRGVALLDDVRPGALVAWAKARAHLLDSCLWPLVPVDVERALRRRGWWR